MNGSIKESAMRRSYPGNSLKRLQSIELEILEAIDQLCRANGLDYVIDGGTCLGAVRHEGFIPWDDDMDIAMPIQDYLKFCQLAKTQLPKGFSLHDCSNTEGFSALWVKVFKDGTLFMDQNCVDSNYKQGIFVDIFPIFRLDANESIAKRQKRQCFFWQSMSYLHYFGEPKISKDNSLYGPKILLSKVAHHTVARLFDAEYCQRKLLKAANAANPGAQVFDPCYATYTMQYDWLFPSMEMEFDGHMLRAPRDCDQLLTCYFGDYMKLPPESQRYTHLPVVLDLGDGRNVMQGAQ